MLRDGRTSKLVKFATLTGQPFKGINGFLGISGELGMSAASTTGELIGTGLKLGLAVTGSFGFAQAATPALAAGDTVAKDMGQWHDAFDSFSVGIGVGGSFFHGPGSLTTTDTYSGNYDGTLSGALNGSSFVGTVEAGRDFRNGNYVFGLYGDITGGGGSSSLTRSYEDTSSGSPGELGSGTYTVKFEHSASIVGRAGWIANERTLLYGLAGYTWQHVRRVGLPPARRGTDGFADGHGQRLKIVDCRRLTLGVGGEMLLNPDVSVKGEYRWTHLNGVPGLSATAMSTPHPTIRLRRPDRAESMDEQRFVSCSRSSCTARIGQLARRYHSSAETERVGR